MQFILLSTHLAPYLQMKCNLFFIFVTQMQMHWGSIIRYIINKRKEMPSYRFFSLLVLFTLHIRHYSFLWPEQKLPFFTMVTCILADLSPLQTKPALRDAVITLCIDNMTFAVVLSVRIFIQMWNFQVVNVLTKSAERQLWKKNVMFPQKHCNTSIKIDLFTDAHSISEVQNFTSWSQIPRSWVNRISWMVPWGSK